MVPTNDKTDTKWRSSLPRVSAHSAFTPLHLLKSFHSSLLLGKEPIPHLVGVWPCPPPTPPLLPFSPHMHPLHSSHMFLCIPQQAGSFLPLGLCICCSFCLDFPALTTSAHPSDLPLGVYPLRGHPRSAVCAQRRQLPCPGTNCTISLSASHHPTTLELL